MIVPAAPRLTTSFNSTLDSLRAVISGTVNSGVDVGETIPTVPRFVLTSADVSESSGFCTQYCAWHTYQNLNGGAIKYAFIGNPEQCPNACEPQTTSPNGNPGADGMASVIAHELEESATDPLLNAWYDSQGNENADKCAWTFGSTYLASNGSSYNMVLNGMEFLIQRNWVNASGGFCATSY